MSTTVSRLQSLDEDLKLPHATGYRGHITIDEESGTPLDILVADMADDPQTLWVAEYEHDDESVAFISSNPDAGEEEPLTIAVVEELDESVIEARSDVLNTWLSGGQPDLSGYSKLVAYALAPLVAFVSNRTFGEERWHIRLGVDKDVLRTTIMPEDAQYIRAINAVDNIDNMNVVTMGGQISQLSDAGVITLLRDPTTSIHERTKHVATADEWASVTEGDVFVIDEVETEELPEVWRSRHPSTIATLQARGLLPDDAEAEEEGVTAALVRGKHFAGIGPIKALYQARLYTQIEFLSEQFFEDRSKLLGMVADGRKIAPAVHSWYRSMLPEGIEEYEISEDDFAHLCATLQAWKDADKADRKSILNRDLFDLPGPLADKYYGDVTTYKITYLGTRRMQ